MKFNFNFVRICFGLFAIRRADTTNYAMFDPDFCGVWSFMCCCSFHSAFFADYDFFATKSVHRAEGREAQFPQTSRQPKKRKNSVHQMVFRVSLVAGVGFEPHDLRVMSPTSYRTAPSRDIIGAGSRGRTGTRKKSHGILSPGRLPIPPFRHIAT